MPLDSEVSDLLKGELVSGARESARLTGMADRNLTQGLGVINSTLIQQHGGVADDAAQMASMKAMQSIPPQVKTT